MAISAMMPSREVYRPSPACPAGPSSTYLLPRDPWPLLCTTEYSGYGHVYTIQYTVLMVGQPTERKRGSIQSHRCPKRSTTTFLHTVCRYDNFPSLQFENCVSRAHPWNITIQPFQPFQPCQPAMPASLQTHPVNR